MSRSLQKIHAVCDHEANEFADFFRRILTIGVKAHAKFGVHRLRKLDTLPNRHPIASVVWKRKQHNLCISFCKIGGTACCTVGTTIIYYKYATNPFPIICGDSVYYAGERLLGIICRNEYAKAWIGPGHTSFSLWGDGLF